MSSDFDRRCISRLRVQAALGNFRPQNLLSDLGKVINVFRHGFNTAVAHVSVEFLDLSVCVCFVGISHNDPELYATAGLGVNYREQITRICGEIIEHLPPGLRCTQHSLVEQVAAQEYTRPRATEENDR